ncbi:MAG: DUF2877 domain-containing protein [Burkholderiales bacterium]|nr:DUF2877 domain-containing protein [Burkholderiales bacterium]
MREQVLAPRVRAIGATAARALHAARGRVTRVEGFAATPFRLAAGQVIWVGASGPMHPRAVFVDGDPDAALDAALPPPWAPPVRGVPDAAAATAALRRLAAALAGSAPRAGFAPLLRGESPDFPLAARAADARALGASAAAGDTDAFARAGARLLGVGTGLTPSGDDFVGAALFTLRLLHPADAAWTLAAARLAAAARSRSHAIGAALFADLAAGASFAPLHALCDAAAHRTADAALRAHAAAVAGIGHSSGWDMLAGVCAAAGALRPTP